MTDQKINVEKLKEALAGLSGENYALQVAVMTLIRLQPETIKLAFNIAYPINLQNFCDSAIELDHPDKWIERFHSRGQSLLRMIEVPSRD